MADSNGEGRGRRKKKRNGWLEKDEADARADDEVIVKRRQPSHCQTQPFVLEDQSTVGLASLKPPPECFQPKSSALTVDSYELTPESIPPIAAAALLTHTATDVSGKSPTDVQASPVFLEDSSTSKHSTISCTSPSLFPSESDTFSIACAESSATMSHTKVTVGTRNTNARKDWPEEVKLHPEVTGGYMTLVPDGTRVICHVCNNKQLACRHPYSLAPVFSESGHVSCTSHKKNLGSRQWCERRDAKRKAVGKEVPSRKYKPQSSLLAAFKLQSETQNPRQAAAYVDTTVSSTNMVAKALPSSIANAYSCHAKRPGKRNACTGIIPLKWVTIKSDITKCNVINLRKYCHLDPELEYEIRSIDGSDSDFNLYLKSCCGEVVHLVGAKQGGTRCTDCMKYWTHHSSLIKKTMKQRNKGIIHAQQCILKPDLTDDDYTGLVNFTRTNKQYFNGDGKLLMEQVHHRINYYKEARNIAALTKTHTSPDVPNGSYVITKNTDSFLHEIVTLFKNNPQLQQGLIGALIQVVAMKMKGHKNPRLPSVAMNFFVASQSLSPRAFDFISANLLGPCRRTILRRNAKDKITSMICIEDEDLECKLTEHMIKLPFYGLGPILISVGFDGTKVPETLGLSIATNTIVGGVYPNHQIDINGKSDEEVMFLLSETSEIERAKEMKVAVVTIQDPGPGQSPYFVIGGQPQGINAVTSFNDRVTRTCLKVCHQLDSISLISVAADGVGCDAKFIRKQLILFLGGKVNHVGLVDTNHNYKNLRYQVIGGSSVLIMGDYVIDPQMLSMGGVAKEIWRPTDWASDLLVLRLNSADTITRLLSLSDEDIGSVAVLAVTLYFTRLKLYAVNAKKAHYRDRITFCWAGLIWITSLECHSRYGGAKLSTIATNCRNIMTETIGMIFSMARQGVKNPRYMTTEALEHTFGAYRAERREPTVLGFTEIEDKVRRRTTAIHSGKLKVSRDPKKGYSSTYSSFVQSIGIPNDTDGGTVMILDDDCAVEKLFVIVGPIINSIATKMRTFLTRFGVKSDAMSTFCRQFDSHIDLLQVYQANLPPDINDEPLMDVSPEADAFDNQDNGVRIPSLNELVQVLHDDNVSEGNGLEDGGSEMDLERVENYDETDLLSGNDELDTTGASRQLRNLLSASTMGQMLDIATRGIQLLHLKNREVGSVTKDQKFKSISERWFTKTKEIDGSGDNDGLQYIERNSLVRTRLVEGKGNAAISGEEDFRVLTVYTKNGKSWHICSKGKQAWRRGMGTGKVRLLMRMITFDYSSGSYHDTDLESSKWSKESIYILVDAGGITNVVGNITLDKERAWD